MSSPATLSPRLPTLFVNHGGGPLPILGDPAHAALTTFMKEESLKGIPEPKAVLVISAHWEESKPTVQTHPQPSLYYDYGGFPEESYHLDYKPPGNPTLAQRIVSLLMVAGFAAPAQNAKRGFDHGMFIPLILMMPKGNIPTIQLSILSSLDPAEHIKLGKALAPLRDEGVLIVGSGMTFHNMGALMQMMSYGRSNNDTYTRSKEFSNFLREAVTQPDPKKREEMLVRWTSAPHARFCHPREEHLLPLHVIAGAAGDDIGQVDKEMDVLGTSVVSVSFGRNKN